MGGWREGEGKGWEGVGGWMRRDGMEGKKRGGEGGGEREIELKGGSRKERGKWEEVRW